MVSLVVLAYPFFLQRNEREGINDAAEKLALRLRRSRDRVYEEIRALQQEYFLKNLTDEEYQVQLQEARHEAASLLKQQQEVQQTLADIDEEIEAQLRKAAGDRPPGSSA